ncbi:hypothetical protein AAG570_009596 [Ranatra chinensis]|uniref:Uncharacterized protein n=1 Tax=Ranatra chinensis TaxID=642074 RepID=A0ABD0YQ43_9HEMI
MASKCRNMFYRNKKQETTKIAMSAMASIQDEKNKKRETTEIVCASSELGGRSGAVRRGHPQSPSAAPDIGRVIHNRYSPKIRDNIQVILRLWHHIGGLGDKSEEDSLRTETGNEIYAMLNFASL